MKKGIKNLRFNIPSGASGGVGELCKLVMPTFKRPDISFKYCVPKCK